MKKFFAALAVLTLGITGYGAYKLLRGYQQEQSLVTQQQQTLASAQKEIQSLSSQASTTQQTIIAGLQKLPNSHGNQTVSSKSHPSVPTTNASTISESEIAPYEGGVAQLNCGKYLGSASLWNLPSFGYVAITNLHVIENSIEDPNPKVGCFIFPDLNVISGPRWYAFVYAHGYKQWNDIADEALIPIAGATNLTAAAANPQGDNKLPVSSLDYKISSLPRCQSKMPLGAPVITLGFPAYAISVVTTDLGTGPESSLIVSDGIISGYDSTPYGLGLPSPNYYVSAKIDSGNSGGIAFSKDSRGLCVLGIPTWVSTGNYENEGVVQNISNVTYAQ